MAMNGRFLCRGGNTPPPIVVPLPDVQGYIYTWGGAINGILANGGTTVNHPTPIEAINLDKMWAQIAISDASTCFGITTQGELYCWGLNQAEGRLPLGPGPWGLSVPVPTQVGTDKDWAKVAKGGMVALKQDGSAWVWGDGNDGRLGDGDTSVHRINTPIQLGTDKHWIDCWNNQSSTMLLKSDGTLWIVGEKRIIDHMTSNVIFLELSHYPLLDDNFLGCQIVTPTDISGCAYIIKQNGYLYGKGRMAALGIGYGASTIPNQSMQLLSTDSWKSITIDVTSAMAAMAVKSDGTLWGWGYSAGWQLGLPQLGTNINLASNYYINRTQVGIASDWDKVYLGIECSLAFKENNTMWSAGNNGTWRTGLGLNTGYTETHTQIGMSENWLDASITFNGLAIRDASAPADTYGYPWHLETDANIQYDNAQPYGDLGIANGLGMLVTTTGAAVAPNRQIVTSTDGLIWTNRSAPTSAQWRGVTFGAGIFVAVAGTGANRFAHSTNGTSWIGHAISDPDSSNWSYVAHGNGKFVAVGAYPGGGGGANNATSVDGVSWTIHKTMTGIAGGVSRQLKFLNGKFIIAAEGGVIYESTDGITWTQRTVAGFSDAIWAVEYGNGLFVASTRGPNGVRFFHSADAITWTLATSTAVPETDALIRDIKYYNGLFVALGYRTDNINGSNPLCFTSPDGVTWTKRDMVEGVWTSIAQIDDKFIALGGVTTGANVRLAWSLSPP